MQEALPADTIRSISPEASDEWYREIAIAYYNDVYRYCRALVFTEADALDLTQNAFLKLGRQLDNIRDRKTVKSWLLTAAYREFVDGYRHKKKFPKQSLEVVPEVSARTGNSHPQDSIDAGSALAALHRLPGHYRAPLALFYLEDASYKEIASILDIPIGTVMSRLRRGKDMLRDALGG